MCFVANPRQSSTNFSMTAPGAMNNHIQAKSVCPARESNPRPSAFCADALTTELRGWDDSTRRNFVTQLVTVLLEHPRACAMGTTPAAAKMAVKDVTRSPTHYPGIVRTGIALARAPRKGSQAR